MIDEKKIEEAAFNETFEMYGGSESLQNGFICGANWAIKQFLRDLWHPFDEVPTRKSSNILLFFESYSTGTEDDFDEYFELAHTKEGFTQETWEEFVNEGGGPSKWLYIDDLFQKKGGDK